MISSSNHALGEISRSGEFPPSSHERVPDLLKPADFRLIFESVPTPCLLLEPTQFRIISVNAAYLLATMTQAEEIMGKGIFEAFPDNPADPDATGVTNLRASLKRVLATRRPDIMTVQKYDIPDPFSNNGAFQERFWNPINTPVLGPNGEVSCIIHRVEDVTDSLRLRSSQNASQDRLAQDQQHLINQLRTANRNLAQEMEERIRAEERLGESETRYAALFNSIDEGFCIFQMIFDQAGTPVDYRFIETNPAFEKQTGIHQAKGKRMKELAPEHERHWFETYGQVVLTGQPVRFVNSAAALGRWFDVYAFRVGKPEDRRVAAIFTDVTTRKKTEIALSESEERFRILVSVITDVPWTMDPTGAFVRPQPAWEEYTGQRWEEHRGFGWMDAVHPEDRAEVLAAWEKSRATGALYECEYRLWNARLREYRYSAARGVALREADGTIREWVGTVTDKHEEKLAEERLERLVAERTAKLQESLNELQTYSYSISHDMRAPLRTLSAYSELLKEELDPTLSGEHKRYLERISAAAQRMDRLITDVLTYSQTARAQLDLHPVNLDHLLEELIVHYPALHNAHVEIVGHLGTVIAVEALLTQALGNLLTNAVKFVAPGQTPAIKIWSEPSPETATESPPPQPGFVRLFIQDNGIGIAPEDQHKIFSIFFRVDHEQKYEGTGIGLSIVQKAVERMGGKVGLMSTPGRGSTFWIDLPKA